MFSGFEAVASRSWKPIFTDKPNKEKLCNSLRYSELVNITESSLLVTNHSPPPSSLQGSSSDSQNHIQDNPAGQPGERLLCVCQLLAPSSGGEEKEEEEAFIYSTLGNFVKLQQHIQCKRKN